MYDIPYCSLAFQLISLTAEKKEPKKKTEKEDAFSILRNF